MILWLRVLTYCICFSLFSNGLFALEAADQGAINSIIQGYVEAWNRYGGKGFGDGFADDADFVNIVGMHFSGKKEIEIRHIAILNTFLKDSIFYVEDSKLREVQPGLVIALVRWKVDGFRAPGSDLSIPGKTREGIFTHVFLKGEHRWEIVATQNTLIP